MGGTPNFCLLDSGNKVGQPLDQALGDVVADHARMAEGPCAAA